MILSASRRTDIPAFYHRWFLRRLQDGFFLMRNPMNARQVSRVPLNPEVVDCIVLWTKNVSPLLQELPALRKLGYEFYVQFTITAYGQDIEPRVPDRTICLESFCEASRLLGRERMVWRYDPVFFNDRWTVARHVASFEEMASVLANVADECVFSFVDQYAKTQRNTKKLQLVSDPGAFSLDFAKQIAAICRFHQMPLNTCAEDQDYSAFGIGHAACISKERIERLRNLPMKVKKDPNQRDSCGCVAAIDMGAYNTCDHGCCYCYANVSPQAVQNNCAAHDPESPLLTGSLGPEDVVNDRQVASLLQRQLRLL